VVGGTYALLLSAIRECRLSMVCKQSLYTLLGKRKGSTDIGLKAIFKILTRLFKERLLG
jgi:hypothetical protein